MEGLIPAAIILFLSVFFYKNIFNEPHHQCSHDPEPGQIKRFTMPASDQGNHVKHSQGGGNNLQASDQTTKVKRGFFNITWMASMVIICSSSNLAFAQDHLIKAVNSQDQQDKSPAGNIEWVKNITKQYSPAAWDILMQYENLPSELEGSKTDGWIVTTKKSVETFHYLKEEDIKTEILDLMSMNIRVIVLALQRFYVFRYTREHNLMMDWHKAEAFFYLSPSRSFYVSFPMCSLFPSRELASVIPDNLRTSLFDNYINKSKTTQRFGVIGLLEEFHSYYFGSRFYLDMLEAYKIAERSDADGFLEWVRHSQSTMSAFYEFDFFIMEYLLYMKKQHTADYKALKACRPFVEAYGAIRLSYEGLISQYLSLIQTEIQRLNSSGKTVVGFENNILWVKAANSNNSKGTRVFMEREKLTLQLNSDRYRMIMQDFPKI